MSSRSSDRRAGMTGPPWLRRAARPVIGILSVLALVPLVLAAGDRAWPSDPVAGPVWPPAPDPVRIRYLARISEPKDIGAGPSWLSRTLGALVGSKRQPRLLRPRGMAVDSAGRLLVADPEQQMVHVLDVGRHNYSSLESAPFASPVGIAVGPGDEIFVTDSVSRRVFAYTKSGKLRASFGTIKGEPIFARPTGIAATRDGRLFVVDTLSASITVLGSASGRVFARFGHRGGGPGEFNYPTDIAVDEANHVYVLDAMNGRVQVLDGDGHFLREFGRRGQGTGLFDKPKGLALDSRGHIYVAESLHDVFQIFDGDGRLLLIVGASGSGPGQFALPSGILIDRQDRVYVADALNSRIQVFQYVDQPIDR